MEETTKTLKEIQVVVFRLLKEEYGVDVVQVKEIMRMQEITAIPNAPSWVRGVINLRNQIISIIDLKERLNLELSEPDDNSRIMVIEVGDKTIGMIVDGVNEVLRTNTSDIDITPPSTHDVQAEYIIGICKLESRLIVMLDLTKVLSLQEVGLLEGGAEKSENEEISDGATAEESSRELQV